jgi:multidrug efflux system membrane fusion protein
MANDTPPPSNDRTLPVPVNDEAASHSPGAGSAHGAGTSDQRSEVPWYRRRWVLVVVVLIIALFLLHHFTKGPTQAAGGRNQQGNATITVGQSRTGDIGIYVNALGTVTPTYTVTVYSQITGRVMEVHYKEGQMVRKGEALIEIDPRPSEATLKQAEGSLQHDQGLLAQARMDLQRYKDAYAKNAIAKQQLDDQEQTVVQYEGTVKADEGTVAYDRVQLEYCHIVSPIAGRVGLRLVDPGNTVFAGSSSTLIVITQLQPITVVFNVSEDDLPRVQEQLNGNNKLAVDIYDRANEHHLEGGTLTSLDNQVDTTTGTVRFRADFANKDVALFPNQFVNARLLVQMLKSVTLVPTPAIQHNGTSDFVYVVKPDNSVAVQTVTSLTTNETDTAVKGLDPNVKIATSGFDRLENGAKVTVRTPGQGKPAAQAQAPGATQAPGQTQASDQAQTPAQTQAPSDAAAPPAKKAKRNANSSGTSQQ